jgi:hypothetical protein
MAPWPTGCKRFPLSSSEGVEIRGGDQALFHLVLCKSLDERGSPLMIWLSRCLFLEQMNEHNYFPSTDINFEK